MYFCAKRALYPHFLVLALVHPRPRRSPLPRSAIRRPGLFSRSCLEPLYIRSSPPLPYLSLPSSLTLIILSSLLSHISILFLYSIYTLPPSLSLSAHLLIFLFPFHPFLLLLFHLPPSLSPLPLSFLSLPIFSSPSFPISPLTSPIPSSSSLIFSPLSPTFSSSTFSIYPLLSSSITIPFSSLTSLFSTFSSTSPSPSLSPFLLLLFSAPMLSYYSHSYSLTVVSIYPFYPSHLYLLSFPFSLFSYPSLLPLFYLLLISSPLLYLFFYSSHIHTSLSSLSSFSPSSFF